MDWKRSTQNVVASIGIASCIGGAVLAGRSVIDRHTALAASLCDEQQQPYAGGHGPCAEGAKPPAAAAEKKGPASGDQQDGQAPGTARSVRAGQDAAKEHEMMLARASYDIAYWSFLATLVFGVVGVLGIYLTFFEAREALDAQRPRRRERRRRVLE